MDFHIFPEVTIEEVKLAHIADLNVQEKYRVKYHQFWVNEEAGTVFCLMEGPDKESCARVHREAHGGVACQITEVEGGFYDVIMGKNLQIDQGLVRHEDGSVDSGMRVVMVVSIIGHTRITHASQYRKLVLPEKPKACAIRKIIQHGGRLVQNLKDDSIICSFDHAAQAVDCSLELQQELRSRKSRFPETEWDSSFRIGINGGQPLTEKEGFFQKTINLAYQLSLIGDDQEIIASQIVEKLYGEGHRLGKHLDIRILGPKEEEFLTMLFASANSSMGEMDWNVSNLSREIGVSRPQLYRKVTALTGRSPVNFIRDLKMNKALILLKDRQRNITEVALELGYSNPSYFAKCFQEKFGVTPSKALI